MSRWKTLLTVIGAVTVLVLAGNTVAFAATGHALVLGKRNAADKITTLKRTSAGSALNLKTTSSSTAPLTVNGTGKVVNLNADQVDGLDATAFVRAGNPALALGYAHIGPGPGFPVDSAWNISAANVATTHAGFYCFHDLGFTPHSAAVTLDYFGPANGAIPVATLKLPAEPSDCDLSSAQAEVFTGVVNPGTTTAGARLGFYVVFY